MPTAFDCPFCKRTFSGADLVRRVASYAPSSRLHLCACPHCAASIECRVHPDEVEVGYTYWAGSLHFEGVETLTVRGLRVADAAGTLCLGDQLLPWWSPPAVRSDAG